MKLVKLQVLSLLALLVMSGCGEVSEKNGNDQVTSVTFVNKAEGTENPSSAQVTIKADLIEYSEFQAGKVVEKWSRRILSSDFQPLQKLIDDYSLFNAQDVTCNTSNNTYLPSNVTLQNAQMLSADWYGVTVIMEKPDSAHSFEIDGSASNRTQWPAGVRELIDFKDSIIENNFCPTYTPPPPEWCSDGEILPARIDEFGCYGPPRCQRGISCPEYCPSAPEWCSDGAILPPMADQNGCYGPPRCQRNL